MAEITCKLSCEKNDNLVFIHIWSCSSNEVTVVIVKIVLVAAVIFTDTTCAWQALCWVSGRPRCIRRGVCPYRVRGLVGETDIYANDYSAARGILVKSSRRLPRDQPGEDKHTPPENKPQEEV